MNTNSTNARIGPIELAPSIRRSNAWTFFYAAFFSIGIITFLSIGQTYILNVHLGIPENEQGAISGNLVVWTELIALLFFIPAGILMDRIGRRPLYVAGFLLIGITYLLYPFAGSVSDLFLYRIIYALGMVAVTGALSTVLVDYPAERSRGKMVALIGLLNGLGIVITNQFFGSLPAMLVKRGMSDIEAGIVTHASVAVIATIAAIVCAGGLQKGVPFKEEKRPGLRELFTNGLTAARNPRILLSYTAAFIARGDQSINGTFISLWGMNAGIAMGLSYDDAFWKGTLIFIITQVAALIWAPLVGPLIDRINRVSALAVCMFLAMLGNLSVLVLDNPFEPIGYLVFILLGIGQISVFLGAQSLIGQEAPATKRGSILGTFNISGAIGILIIAKAGGNLFDSLSPQAPFVIVGTINALLMFFSIYVRIKAPHKLNHATDNA
ncbi:MFS transporter [Prosthecochloris sp. N3]|uniref:MFS transporter n=1 Tax=Prosthecochloris ethylica TaxID=2743976 RepID=A0ABR9XT54_9CHLB|nr:MULTISPECIES: MFS transporter [Prosthecochloris]MBF0585583.1 MFS transporter [Prosthecochloris ethylica]MBF0637124.1 MFS transporter [Prosthecochloris ethylica]NUK46813.1 MFS transporter [Prosthecochloris ethylica]RNA64611.1 MFS transporter [Prosthecochloris sp. ZM_2]